MKEVFRSTNPGEAAAVTSLLEGTDIPFFVFDLHANTMYGGAVGGLACRFMVTENFYEEACAVLHEAGLEIST